MNRRTFYLIGTLALLVALAVPFAGPAQIQADTADNTPSVYLPFMGASSDTVESAKGKPAKTTTVIESNNKLMTVFEKNDSGEFEQVGDPIPYAVSNPCDALDTDDKDYELVEKKDGLPASGTWGDFEIAITEVGDYSFKWSLDESAPLGFGIGAVIIKGGTGANAYVYDDAITDVDTPNDTVFSPTNREISNVSFCKVDVEFTPPSPF